MSQIHGSWSPAPGNDSLPFSATDASQRPVVVVLPSAPPAPPDPRVNAGTFSPAPGNTAVPFAAQDGSGRSVLVAPPVVLTAVTDPRTNQGTFTPLDADGAPVAARAPDAPGGVVAGTFAPTEPAAPAAPRTPATGAVIPVVVVEAPAAPRTPATGAAIPEIVPAPAVVEGDPNAVHWQEVDEGFTVAAARRGPGKLDRAYLLSGRPGEWTLTATTRTGLARGSQAAPGIVGDADHARAWAGGVIESGWTGDDGE